MSGTRELYLGEGVQREVSTHLTYLLASLILSTVEGRMKQLMRVVRGVGPCLVKNVAQTVSTAPPSRRASAATIRWSFLTDSVLSGQTTRVTAV